MMTLNGRILQLLTQGTKQKPIRWEHLQGQCYRSEGEGWSYFLDWVYWYDTSSITVGRMGLVLSYRDRELRVVWGTPEMEAGKELLESIDIKWSDHFEKMNKDCHTMFEAQTPSDQTMKGTKQLWLTTLQLLLDAAKQGKMKWVRHPKDSHRFYTVDYPHNFEITLFSPIDGEEKPIYNLFAELGIPGSQLCVVSGTDGFFLIEELLSYYFEDFRSQREQTQQALLSEIDFLQRLLEPSS